MVATSQFQSKILRKKTTPDEYRVYLAGLEWDLTDPIVIESRNDFKSEYRWRDRLKPYHHQVNNLITFCRRLPVTLLADDVGLGKTISAGLIISELISRSRLSKILVVCPKLLGPQWKEELETKFDIPSEIAIGRELISADPEEIGAIITTYATARMHLDAIPEDRFQMLILDEAHKLRNLYGVNSPPQVAKRFRDALEQRRFRFVLMLTATPIQNRLWDLYSLVDLLSVARGHENPFGSEGMFARKFIADNRDQARQLKTESQDEFRSIVYSYMSRVRRGDAKLYFPDRLIQMHRVDPTQAELDLIRTIAKPIQKLNRLVQISILQALTSSPEALRAQLDNMARNGTAPAELAASVRIIVNRMPASAKLRGLGELIDRLTQENPERWRMVIFTGRLETQTTIQLFLEERDLTVGIINGSSGPRNQETIQRFRKNPPACHVIVSTEAGSEGVNLQVANVLVNYDLPWNPMIVEQRIGRIQRLASEHASVAVFNVMLRGTFEEYIVGRLIEKLQMASHAIGDIEALLEASGIGDDNDDGAAGFEERIRKLVIAALTGKNVEEETRQAELSIAEAKRILEKEEANINKMIGSMNGTEYVGPRAPTLPPIVRSMDFSEFSLAALKSLGAKITPVESGLYLSEETAGREYIRFTDQEYLLKRSTLYAPGSAAFLRLVSRTIATGVYEIEDLDINPNLNPDEIARKCVGAIGVKPKDIEVEDVKRVFEGTALIRVRATTAHDSYERLVDVLCSPTVHHKYIGRSGLSSLESVIEDPALVGIDVEALIDVAKTNPGISEFCRFYLERRFEEIQSAGNDDRKRKKLEDEFTPRLDMTLVALNGQMYRQLKLRARYSFDSRAEYSSTVTVVPHTGEIADTPERGTCAITGRIVPRECLKKCEISGAFALAHLLIQSDTSSRVALPQYTVVCALTGKRVLQDEAELSAVSKELVAREFLKTSSISGKRAEPQYFSRCEFTNVEVLSTELSISEVSGKKYRLDEQMKSSVSGKTGHRLEFIRCYETQQPLLESETEICEITGNRVRRGLLEQCSVTQKRVLPRELERCSATGKKALKNLLVTSNITQARILESISIRSAMGNFCAPIEAKTCQWIGEECHPEDIKTCILTDLQFHFRFITTDDGHPRLKPLIELLDGIKRTSDKSDLWDRISIQAAKLVRTGRCNVEAAVLSPDTARLAVCCEIRTMLGFRTRYAGLVYSIAEDSIVGRVAQGRRNANRWAAI